MIVEELVAQLQKMDQKLPVKFQAQCVVEGDLDTLVGVVVGVFRDSIPSVVIDCDGLTAEDRVDFASDLDDEDDEDDDDFDDDDDDLEDE